MRKRERKGWRHLRGGIFPIVLLLGMLASLSLAHAADEPQFGIRPANPSADAATSGYFTLKAQAGDTLKDAVVVVNPGTVPIKVALYPVDATSGQRSGAVYMGDTDPRTGVGAWITMDKAFVEIAPQKQETVPFTITVPKETHASQYLGGIAVQLDRGASDATQEAGSFGVTTVTRALTAVLVNVGEITAPPSLHITGAQIADVDGLPSLTLSVQNDGEWLVKSHGDVTMTDAAGKTALSSQLTLDTLVPRTTIAYPIQEEPPTALGTYHVHATLDFGGNAPAVFDGPLVIAAQPTAAPAAPSGRTRPTPAAARAAAPAAAPAVVSAPAQRGDISPLVAILSGLTGTFVVVMIGLIVVILRSKGRKQRE
ncbi:MAG: WxL protein peptidoglycan domain-containing protein [Thermomicrobiales bacterium]